MLPDSIESMAVLVSTTHFVCLITFSKLPEATLQALLVSVTANAEAPLNLSTQPSHMSATSMFGKLSWISKKHCWFPDQIDCISEEMKLAAHNLYRILKQNSID